MAFATGRLQMRRRLRPLRLLLALLLAPFVPSLMLALASMLAWRNMSIVTSMSFVLVMGYAAMLFPFGPLLAWRLTTTRRPFLFCVLAGAVSAPGPLGYMLLTGGILRGTDGLVASASLLTGLAPLGIIGGCVFYMCAIWRDPGFATTTSTNQA